MRSRRPLLGVALLLATATTAGCGLQRGLDGEAAGPAAATAPRIAGTALDGVRVDTAGLRGHPVVVDFWASWCGPCRAEQPELNELQRRYGPRGVAFIGVDLRDNDAAARSFVEEYHVPYHSLPDPGAEVAGAFDVAAPPEAVVIDGGGRVVKRLLGTTVGIADALDGLLR